ncbi:NUDIX domain-containing protein [Gordonia sp. VNK1]|uniref:NUDIX hydrolase n=1 Tax=Gordonia oleivorans TaxID=3156618 RepID=UPI0032B34308
MSPDPPTDPRDASGDVGAGRGPHIDGGHHRTGATTPETSMDPHPARGTPGQGRRRPRRGRRRRRSPEPRATADTHAPADTTDTDAEVRRPSPADLAGRTRRPHGGAASDTPTDTPVNGSPTATNPTVNGHPGPHPTRPHPAEPPTERAVAHKSPKPGDRRVTPGDMRTKPGDMRTKPGDMRTKPGDNRTKPGDNRNPAPGDAAAMSAARVSGPKPSDMAAVMTAKITKTGLSQDTSAPTAVTPTTRNRRRGSKRPEKGERLRTVRETSAGGLVLSDLDLPVEELAAALIGRVDRRGRMMWSLPKGHIETGETAEQTAVREVAEETGIQGTVVAPLGKIDYWFVSEGRRIHKTVHHYLLRSVGGELSDEDYEVSEVAWVPLHELPRRLTYSDERRLARMARGVIADLTGDPDRLAESEAQSSRTEPNAYERAAAARNQRRNEPPPPARSRRRRRRPRRPAAGDG